MGIFLGRDLVLKVKKLSCIFFNKEFQVEKIKTFQTPLIVKYNILQKKTKATQNKKIFT